MTAPWQSAFTEAPFDAAELVRGFREWDDSHKQGWGESGSADTGALGWGESSFLESYASLYEITGDVHWLRRIADHADRIFGHRHDHFGDSGPTWVTDRYSVAWIRVEALHNRGTGSLDPVEDRVWTIRGGEQASDSDYVFEVVARGRYELKRWPDRKLIASGAVCSSRQVTDLAPFKLRLSGRTQIGDRFRIQTFRPLRLEYIVHQGRFLYPIARFCEFLRRVKGLSQRLQRAGQRYEAIITEVAEKHERDWLDTGRGAGAYRFAPSSSERYPNRILPHNQYLAFARTLLVMASISRRKLFAARARAMARNFRRALRPVGDAWEWHYWDWVESGVQGHSNVEDTSHGHIDVGFAAEACRRGVVFTDTDLRRFGRTLVDRMWNGQLRTKVRVGQRVDTVEGDDQVIRDWIDLGQWESAAWEIGWSQFFRIGRPAVQAPIVLQGWLRCRHSSTGTRR
ncbi:MAG: hypothetical protein VX733_13040 [Candidatus Latescibacterota bacterium]|nr:hypothetical protein [Candidatus Latescibacterota bacterium]